MNLNFSIVQNGSIQVLETGNLLSEYTNREILAAVQSKIEAGFSTFVVDMSAVEYINSVGLNFLLTLQSRSEEQGGRIALAKPSNKVLQLLKMTKLLPLFQLKPSVEAALEFLADKK